MSVAMSSSYVVIQLPVRDEDRPLLEHLLARPEQGEQPVAFGAEAEIVAAVNATGAGLFIRKVAEMILAGEKPTGIEIQKRVGGERVNGKMRSLKAHYSRGHRQFLDNPYRAIEASPTYSMSEADARAAVSVLDENGNVR